MKEKLHPITDVEKKLLQRLSKERSMAETRFPLLFGLLITFGFVSTLYGFEKIIDNSRLSDNPLMLLGVGLLTLLLTGTAYKKLN